MNDLTTKVDIASPSVYQEMVQDQLRLLSNLGVNPDNNTFRELINGAGEDNEYVCVGCLHPFRFAQVIGVEVNSLEERKLNLAKELKRSQQRLKNNNFWLARPQTVREYENLSFYNTTVTEGLVFLLWRGKKLWLDEEIEETHVFMASQLKREWGRPPKFVSVKISKVALQPEARLLLQTHSGRIE